MITTFETGGSAASGESKGSGKTIMLVIGAAALLFVAYKFWWKPMQDKKKQEAK